MYPLKTGDEIDHDVLVPQQCDFIVNPNEFDKEHYI